MLIPLVLPRMKAGRARRFPGQVRSGSVLCAHCSGSRRERGFRCRLFRRAGERRCVRRDRRRMAPRLAEGSSIRSDDQHVHGQFVGAARPSGGMAFSQEPTSFCLQNGDEISDMDHCLILIALLWGEPPFGAFVGEFLDPPASPCRHVGGAATRRSGGQGIARQPQARAPKQFALNRRHNQKNRIAGFQVKPAVAFQKWALCLEVYDVTSINILLVLKGRLLVR
jgi:hypothetical protein